MNLSKIRSGRLELAVCIVAPLLVLAVIAIPGHLYCRNLRLNLLARQACLDQVPEMERQLAASQQVLQPFAVASAEGDKAAELTLTAEKAAQTFGFTTRSANVDKQAGDGGGVAWVDYKVVVSGDGTLKSIIGMLDFLEHPSQRFRVSQVTLQSKGGRPEATYEGSVVLVSRMISPAATAGAGSSAPILTARQGSDLAGRLAQLTASVTSWIGEKRAPLVIALKSNPQEPGSVETPRPTSLFTLNGIIRDKKNPLAMTDRGLFGVGDDVDGYKILSIANDQVMVQGKGGSPEVVRLYSDKRPSDDQEQGKRDDSSRPDSL